MLILFIVPIFCQISSAETPAANRRLKRARQSQQAPIAAKSAMVNTRPAPDDDISPGTGRKRARIDETQSMTPAFSNGAPMGAPTPGAASGAPADDIEAKVHAEFQQGNIAVLVAEPGSKMFGTVVGVSPKFIDTEFKAGRGKTNELKLDTTLRVGPLASLLL